MEWQKGPSLLETPDGDSPRGSVDDVDTGEGSSSEVSFPSGVHGGSSSSNSGYSSQEMNPTTPHLLEFNPTYHAWDMWIPQGLNDVNEIRELPVYQPQDLWTPHGLNEVNETRELSSPHFIHMNSTTQTNDVQTPKHIDLNQTVDARIPHLFEMNPTNHTLDLQTPHVVEQNPNPNVHTDELALVRDLALVVSKNSTYRTRGQRMSMDHQDFLSFGLGPRDETMMDLDERVEAEPNEDSDEAGWCDDITRLETLVEDLNKISMENDPTTTPTTPSTP